MEGKVTKKETRAELKRLIEFYGGNPPMDIILQQLNLSEEEAKELMDIVMAPKVKRIYKKRTPAKKPIGERIGEILHNIPIGIIRFMCTIIAIIALLRSGGYVYSHFARIDTTFFAVLMAGMIVMVSFVSPQILVYSYKRKSWFTLVLSIILMVVFAWFNIDVTIRGLAYAREQVDYYVSAGQEDIVKAKRRLIELDKKEAIILQDRERDGQERDTLQSQFEALAGEIGSDLYISTRSRLNATKERYDKHRGNLEAIDTERTKLNKIEGLDSVRIKDDATKVQESSMDKIIAIGLELAGPITLAFALFL
jgi:hypothetical protein